MLTELQHVTRNPSTFFEMIFFFFIIFVRLCNVKDIIFILNSNLTSLSFYESWLFNMVSDFGIFISHGTRGNKHKNMRFIM